MLLKGLKAFFYEKGSFEIIVINDGGKPTKLSEDIILLDFDKNRGKNYALFEGFKIARGEWILTIDDDGQHPVSEISKLIARQDHDVVIGKYESENRIQSVFKHWTEVLLFAKNSRIRFTPFKLIRRRVLNLSSFENRVPFVSILLLESTKDIVEVEVNVNTKENKNSRFSIRRKFNFYRNLVASKNEFFRKLMGVKLKY